MLRAALAGLLAAGLVAAPLGGAGGSAAGAGVQRAQGESQPERTLFVAGALSVEVAAIRVRAQETPRHVTGSPFAAAPGAFAAAVSPDGRFLYVGYSAGLQIGIYAIGADGGITPTASSPLVVNTPVAGLAMSPDGSFLIATTGEPNVGLGGVRSFSVAADGSLTQVGEPLLLGGLADPIGLPALTPDGRNLYVAAYVSGQVFHFEVAPDGGLTPSAGPTRRAGSLPVSPTVSPDGRFLYAVNEGDNTVAGFAIGSDGALTGLPGAPYPAGVFPHGVTISPDQRFAWVPNLATNSISAYAVGVDGRLSELPGSPVPSGVSSSFPGRIVSAPDGRTLYSVEVGSLGSSGSPSAHLDVYKVLPSGLPELVGSSLSTKINFSDGPASVITPNQGPVARIAVADKGRTTVRLTAAGSTDPDGAIAEYVWDLGDGSAPVTTTGPTVEHRYAAGGEYDVSVRVVDGEACSDRLVYTGQTVLCRGGARAVARHRVAVPGPRRGNTDRLPDAPVPTPVVRHVPVTG